LDLDGAVTASGSIAVRSLFPIIPALSVPTVTAGTMRELDRLAVEEFGIDVLQMMELAGLHLAELVRVEVGGELRGRRVIVAVGPGNNGGGGLVAGRHLANRGASVRVVLARPVNRLKPPGRHQVATLLQMAVDCCVAIYDVSEEELASELGAADAVVDAILGYGGTREPDSEVGRLIAWVTGAVGPIVSLDLPSGMDPDTGTPRGLAVTAQATLTLALPKAGLFGDAGRKHTGRIFLADIGLPAALYDRLGLDSGSPFAAGPIVRLEPAA
jgi:NAD(P)H-hydrate epimerase